MSDMIRIFDQTLRAVLTVPELALFVYTALLLIIVGIFSWVIRRGKKV